MKLLLVLTVVCLGSAWAHPGWFSSMKSTVSDTAGALRQTAVSATSGAVNAAKSTTDMAVNAAKSTTNMAVNAAGSAKNMTVNAAKAGVNLVKDISLAAINKGIGFLIEQVKTVVRKTGRNTIHIPDINQKAGPIGFSATRGYFKDITTLVQDGKANVTTNGTSLDIDFPIKLNKIDIGYKQFNVTMMKMNFGGGIKIHIKNDSFIVHMRLTPGFTCALNVEKVEVAVLSGIEIDFIDVGKSEWLLEKASNLIVTAIKGQIKAKVQDAIDSSIKNALKEDSAICSKFLS